MQTSISDNTLATDWGQEANAILRKCVHCGFCNATCPTYQLLGDEQDGPRGRIYLMKQIVEGHAITAKTQLHLDRCLTCRNCETTCPSGVEYSRLVDIGRELTDEKIKRPFFERLQRQLLINVLTRKKLFNTLLLLGRSISFLLPKGLQRQLNNQRRLYAWPDNHHARIMLYLGGCVQPGLMPNINLATARVLDRLGISLKPVPQVSCCGAVHWHLSEAEKAKHIMKANIDAWWPQIEDGAEAIVVNASACSLMLKEYGYYLRNDKDYAEKARRFSSLVKDISEVLADEDLAPFAIDADRQRERIAFHPPCTLQHGQRLSGKVESILTGLGFELSPVNDSHLCCGAAGTYSILQKTLSKELLKRKLTNLYRGKPTVIASANIGCLLHLQSQSGIEVKHWIELLDP